MESCEVKVMSPVQFLQWAYRYVCTVLFSVFFIAPFTYGKFCGRSGLIPQNK